MAEKSFDLVIKGFKTKSQVMEFIAWYEGQGEQDSSDWFEQARHDGKIGVTSMNMNMSKHIMEAGTEITIWVDPK